MPDTVEGVVTIVQEGRFQLTDDAGVSHLFVLGHAASAETDQLGALRWTRVRVRCHDSPGVIGRVASRLERMPAA